MNRVSVKVTPEISRVLQEFLFKCGREWLSYGEKVSFLSAPFLFICKHDNSICYSKNEVYSGKYLVSLEDFIYIAKNGFKNTVDINSETYNPEDIETKKYTHIGVRVEDNDLRTVLLELASKVWVTIDPSSPYGIATYSYGVGPNYGYNDTKEVSVERFIEAIKKRETLYYEAIIEGKSIEITEEKYKEINNARD